MTPKFNFIVCSIEESKDIDMFSLDELQSFLLAHEQKVIQQEKKELVLKMATNLKSSGRGKGKREDRNSYQSRLESCN